MSAAESRPPADGVPVVGRGEAVLLVLLFAVALACRTWNLAGQGLRTPDEGLYVIFAEQIHLGNAGSVYFKPLQGLLLYPAFRALTVTGLVGLEPVVFMLPAAAIGLATVALLAALARRAWGPHAGLVALGCTAAMPYLLFYHRSALTDGVYLGAGVLAFGLLLRALPGVLPGAAPRRPWVRAATSGALLGAAFFDNPATGILVAGIGCGGVALWAQGRVPRRDALRLGSVWALSGLGAAAAVFGLLCLRPWFRVHDFLSLSQVNVASAFGSGSGAGPFRYLWAYAGPAYLALAAVGLVAALRRRGPFELALLGLGAVVFAYALWSRLWWPRIYVGTVFPLTLLAALGGATVAAAAAARTRRPHAGLGVAAGLCALLLAGHAAGARAMLTLTSGYAQAAEVLQAEPPNPVPPCILTPQCANLLLPFGLDVRSATVPLARALEPPGGAERAEELLARCRQEGYTHLVLDYTFRIEMRDAGLPELRRLIDRNPPWQSIPNPAGAHAETLLESDVRPAAGDPISDRILIFRLEEMGQGRK